jgi:hypothetical protein
MGRILTPPENSPENRLHEKLWALFLRFRFTFLALFFSLVMLGALKQGGEGPRALQWWLIAQIIVSAVFAFSFGDNKSARVKITAYTIALFIALSFFAYMSAPGGCDWKAWQRFGLDYNWKSCLR